MQWKAGILLILAIILSGCNFRDTKSGIEIISYPTAKVFIDNKEAGMTPYKNNSLKPGEVEIKLESKNITWTKKVRLQNGANTVINREFGSTSDSSGGYILYFESTGSKDEAGILISSRPDRATIAIEDEIIGYSPIRQENVGEGDKKLVISFPGHKSISSFVKFVNGYQLVVEADLPMEELAPQPEMVTATPTTNKKMVIIKSPETGWLRVREGANSSSLEIGKVDTNDNYELLEEKIDWYKIKLNDGKEGWISSKYAEKLP